MALPPVHTPESDLSALLAELGACLITYQRIELALQLLLPFMVRPGETRGTPSDAVQAWDRYLDAGNPLGVLVGKFRKNVSGVGMREFNMEWQAIVKERNEIVHKFLRQPFGALSSPEEIGVAAQYVRTRHHRAIQMVDILQPMVIGVHGAPGPQVEPG